MQYQIQMYYWASVIRQQREPESFLPYREDLEEREERGGRAVIEKFIEPYEKDIGGLMTLYRREGRIGGKV